MTWISIFIGNDWLHAVGFGVASIAIISLLAICITGLLRRHAAFKDGLLLSALIVCLVVPLIVLFTAVYQSSIIALPVAVLSKADTNEASNAQSFGDTSIELAPESKTQGDIAYHEDIESNSSNSQPIEGYNALTARNTRMADALAGLLSVPFIAMATWLLVTAFLLASGWRSHRRGRAIRCRAIPMESDLLSLCASLASQQVGLHRIPTILGSDEIYSPVVQGIFTPMFIVPKEVLHQLSGDQLHDVLVHEFAHIRRRDTMVVFCEMIARSLLWPIFTVQFMIQKLGRTREDICDNYVLLHRNSIDYAETLLKLAEFAQGRIQNIPSVGILKWQGSLEKRIAGIISEQRSRSICLPQRIFVLLFSIVVLIGIALAGSRLVAIEGPAKETDTSKTSENIERARSAETASARIGVVDWQGKPVVDAQVELWQLAYSSEKGFGGGSQAPDKGYAFNGRTDQKGEIVVPYPTVVGPDEMPATSLGLRIVTPDHPTWSDYHAIDDAQAIALSRPIIISIAAKLGLNGSLVSSDLYAMTGRAATTWKWEDARLVSGPVDASDGQLRVIYAPENGPAWFSKLIDLKKNMIDENRITIDAVLEPSVTLRGKLGDEIALPIRNGRIIARASTAKDDDQNFMMAVGYVTPISTEGEFELKNLPAQSHVQLLAVSDGGVSRSPWPAEVREYSQQRGYVVSRYHGGNAGRTAAQLYFADADAPRLSFLWPQLVMSR